jgi:hypothetical protein
MKDLVIILLVLNTLSCKKSDERQCYKSFDEIIEVEYPIDSVQEFKLYKKIKYKFYQDSLRKIVVKTGVNLQQFIAIQTTDYVTTINNNNKCDFLRNNDKKVEVDIHYPHYNKIYAEPSDSMIFVDTLRGDYTNIHLRDGGGTLILNVNLNQIQIGISYGAGNFIVGGQVNFAHLSIQNLAYADALNLHANNLSVYHNSNNDLLTNFDSSNVNILFYANGDVRFIGEPSSLSVEGVGDGEVIHY